MKKTTKIPGPPADEGWERIRFADVVAATEMGPKRERWRWERQRKNGRTLLFLRKPDGSMWQFKLQGGAWLRRMTT